MTSSIRASVRRAIAAGAARFAMLAQKRNRKSRPSDSLDDEIKIIIGCMTNHERNRWARAGYPADASAAKGFLGPFADRRIMLRRAAIAVERGP